MIPEISFLRFSSIFNVFLRRKLFIILLHKTVTNFNDLCGDEQPLYLHGLQKFTTEAAVNQIREDRPAMLYHT